MGKKIDKCNLNLFLSFFFQFFLCLLDSDLPGAPGDNIEVGDAVDNEEQVHAGDAEEVHESRHDAPELLGVKAGRYEEGSSHGDQEDR